MSFSSDHRFLATATSATADLLRRISNAAAPGSAQVWNLDSSQPVTQPLDHGGEWGVHVAQFHPSRQLLLTAGGEGCAYLWRLEPEAAPVDALHDLAELLSHHHLDEQGILVPVERLERDHWERVREVLRDRSRPGEKTSSSDDVEVSRARS